MLAGIPGGHWLVLAPPAPSRTGWSGLRKRDAVGWECCGSSSSSIILPPGWLLLGFKVQKELRASKVGNNPSAAVSFHPVNSPSVFQRGTRAWGQAGCVPPGQAGDVPPGDRLGVSLPVRRLFQGLIPLPLKLCLNPCCAGPLSFPPSAWGPERFS